MKRRYTILGLIFLFFYILPSILHATGSSLMAAEPSVYDSIQKGQSNNQAPPPDDSASKEVVKSDSPSLFPLLVKFIVSFAFVIVLLVLLLKLLSKRTRVLQSNGPVFPLASYALGNNRSVQVVLVGETIYVLGVGDSVNLLRAIPQGEEYQHLLKGYENQADGRAFLPKDIKQKWNHIFGRHMNQMDHENGEE